MGVGFAHQSRWLSTASNGGCRRQIMLSVGGTIEGIMGNMWVHQKWLGVDGGGRGGRQRQGGGGGLLFFRIDHVVCCLGSKVRRRCVSLHIFFVKYFYPKEHPGSLVLTQHKNLHVCWLFIFRLQLIMYDFGWHVSHRVFSAEVARIGPIVSKI